jgi:Protein of unknown function (DUF992)
LIAGFTVADPGGAGFLKEEIMFRALTIITVSTAALAATAPAFADTVQVGVLECAGGPSVGFVVGSSTGFSCVFTPSTGRGREGYVAQMNRIGLDLGVTAGTGIGWLVFAPSANIKRGALAGNYGGVSANAAVVLGGGANLLAGGFENSMTLQPISVQGQTGLNVAATVSNLELRPVVTASAVTKKKKSKKKKS